MSKSARLYLASQSPRRRELLSQLHISFTELVIDFPEVRQPDEKPEIFVVRMAEEKARAGWSDKKRILDIPVLAADTIVVIDGDVLGKPRNQAEGLAMLQCLSGRTHQVLTSVCLRQGQHVKSLLSMSTVSFRELSEKEMDLYWESGEPRDKAGAYGVQGFGALFITRLEGSYSGVMGLPLCETAQLLHEFEIDILT